MWIDITYPITNTMPSWPGQPEVEISHLCKINDGANSNVTLLNFSAHTGTHMDAPLHFLRNGADITQFPLEIATGRVRIINIANTNVITLEEIRESELESGKLKKGENVFFKTNNSRRDWTKEPFDENYVYLSKEAARYLVEKKTGLVGIDYLSISAGDINLEVHQLLLGNNCWIVEGLDLRNVNAGKYDLICLPLKIAGADGSPARVLIRPLSS